MTFDRYTDRARRALVLAQDEARNLGHSRVGTGHLLLGLIGEDGGTAAQALRALGASLEDARQVVSRTEDRMVPPRPGEAPPFTPRLARVLEGAVHEAMMAGNNYIATEHLLLALVAGSAPGASPLVAIGVNPDDTRAKVMELLHGYETAGEMPPAPESVAASSADSLSALEEIRQRARWKSSADGIAAPGATAVKSAGDVPRLLAVVDAVLKLADDAKPRMFASPADCTRSCDTASCDCSGDRRPLAWNLDPAALREAVVRGLTGEEESSGPAD